MRARSWVRLNDTHPNCSLSAPCQRVKFRPQASRFGSKDSVFSGIATSATHPSASMRAAACQSGVGARDWAFVAETCPAESEKLAGQHCAGREYTVAMSSEYKPICGKHSNLLAKGGRSYTAAKASERAAQPAAPSAADAVKEGVRGLKNLFGR